MMVDYHVHAVAHGEYQYTREWLEQFIEQARRQGIMEIGFSEHDEFVDQIDFNLVEKVQNSCGNEIKIRLGLEVDFIPGRQEKTKEIICQKGYDYIIGSVHYIDGWGFDHPDHKNGFDERDIDEIYSQYSRLLVEMITSGSFDVVGHLDLIKIWGHRPRKKPSRYYFEPVLKAAKAFGLAVEINSAGLRKVVEELYPAADLLEMMYAYSIPITFGSDAHHPTQVGEGLAEAYLSARKAGYRVLVRIGQHKKLPTPMEY